MARRLSAAQPLLPRVLAASPIVGNRHISMLSSAVGNFSSNSGGGRRRRRDVTPTLVHFCGRASGKLLQLTTADVESVANSWPRLWPEKKRLVERIFIDVFGEPSGSIAAHFGLDDLDVGALRCHATFVRHVKKFARFLQSLVEAIGDEDEAKFLDTVENAGLAHGKMRGVSFTADKWLVFKQAILKHLSGKTKVYYNSWNKVLIFVIGELKATFLKAVLCRNSEDLSASAIPTSQNPSPSKKSSCPMEFDSKLKPTPDETDVNQLAQFKPL